MYCPIEANKPCLQLLKEQGIYSAIKSLAFVAFVYFFNVYLGGQATPVSELLLIYFFFCVYFTWKPKLVRFLRGKLLGDEHRDKLD